MTYAVIRFGGKQFKVSEGTTIKVERQTEVEPEVLMFVENDTAIVGSPLVDGYSVELNKIEDKRAKKIRIGRFKSKSRYRKVKGHKQPITVFEVTKLGKKGTKKVEEKPKQESKPESASTETKKPGRPKKVESSKKDTPKKRGRPKKE